jgi:hypothetical protein
VQQKVKLTRACYGLAFRVPFWAWLRHFMPKKSHSMPAVNVGVSFRKRPKRIKSGAVKVVNKENYRTSHWLSAAKAG